MIDAEKTPQTAEQHRDPAEWWARDDWWQTDRLDDAVRPDAVREFGDLLLEVLLLRVESVMHAQVPRNVSQTQQAIHRNCPQK